MPKGDHILISDELQDWIEANADDPERVGRMMIAAVRYWASGGQSAGAMPDDLQEVAGVFLGQLDRFRGAVEAAGGMSAEDRREYKRRTVANSRARKRGEPEPYPDPRALLPSCRGNTGNSGNSGNTGNSGNSGNTGNKATQGNANQSTCASAHAREAGPMGFEEALRVGAAAGLPTAEVEAWWDYYAALDWAPSAKAGPNARMSRDAAIASLRKWQRNRAVYGDSGRPRAGRQRAASAIRDLDRTTEAERKESERRNGW